MAELRLPGLNCVQVAGRLSRDPELKYTSGGQAYCRFDLANTRHYKDKAGQRQETVTWVGVVLWGPAAEWIGQTLRKGDACIVQGRLATAEWTGKDGQRKTKLEVVADSVMPLQWEAKDGQGRERAGNAEAQRPQRSAEEARQPRQPELPAEDEPPPDDDIPF